MRFATELMHHRKRRWRLPGLVNYWRRKKA